MIVLISKIIQKIFYLNAIKLFFYGVVICLIIPNLMYYLIYKKRDELQYSKNIIKNILKKF